MSDFQDSTANENFNRARGRALLARLLHAFDPRSQRLLSLDEAKKTLRPTGETYRGLQFVPIDRIVGSEGRYRDFSRSFLPKHDHMRQRWTSIDRAHQSDIILPAVRLYEIADCYFVRDGNHRVSVAKTLGMQAIDAEVISLKTAMHIEPTVTASNLKRSVIEHERRCFYKRTGFGRLVPEWNLRFSEVGRYDEIQRHIEEHKYYINLDYQEEIAFDEAVLSWFNEVFTPIIEIIRAERVMAHFPGRTSDDLYLWIVRHWHLLKEQSGSDYPIREAVGDFVQRFSARRRDSNRSTNRLIDRITALFIRSDRDR